MTPSFSENRSGSLTFEIRIVRWIRGVPLSKKLFRYPFERVCKYQLFARLYIFATMLELNFKEYGTGDRNLIVLHGFLGSLDNWHTLATEWANAGLHVYSLDLRNHGKSPHTDEHTLQLMVDDLNDFMFQHHIPEATVLGHSMGGKVAMLFALLYPTLCTKLIVADIAPRLYKRGHDEVFDAIFQVSLDKITTRKEAEAAMKPYLGDFGTRQFILKSLERTEEGKYNWKFNLKTLFQDYDEIIKGIEVNTTYNKPALFVKGAQSAYIQASDEVRIAELFPLAGVQSVAEAGHWIHADQPKAFYQIVIDFVNS
jgi:esterase